MKALTIALGCFTAALSIGLFGVCSIQAFIGTTRNSSKAFVHKVNFAASLILSFISVDVPRVLYPWQILVVAWALVKGLIIVSLYSILLKVLQAKAQLKERELRTKTRSLLMLCTATTVVIQIAEMCASLSVGSVGGGPFAAVELLLISAYSFISIRPLVFLRDQQKGTIEVLMSSRKEAFQHAVSGDAIFKALMRKLNNLIRAASFIAVVSLVLSVAIIVVMGVQRDAAIGIYRGNEKSELSLSIETILFTVYCGFLCWPIYYSWVPVKAVQLRSKFKSQSRHHSRSGSRKRNPSIRSVSRPSPKQSTTGARRQSSNNMPPVLLQSVSLKHQSSNSNVRKIRTKSSEEVHDRRFSSTQNRMRLFIQEQDGQTYPSSSSNIQINPPTNGRSVSLGLPRTKDLGFPRGHLDKSTDSVNAITPNAKSILIPSIAYDEKQHRAVWNGTGSVSETKDSKSGGHRSTYSGGAMTSPVVRRESSSTTRAMNNKVTSLDNVGHQHPFDITVV